MSFGGTIGPRRSPEVEVGQEAVDGSDTTAGIDRIRSAKPSPSQTAPASKAPPPRYRKLALAALKPLARPTEAMVDAAHEGDAFWAINSRADFKKAVRAMIRAAMER